MIEGLNTSELRRALHALGELSAARELRDYPVAVARALRALIPSDLAGYNALDLTSRRAIVAADPPDCVFDGGQEALARFMHQNPMASRALRVTGEAMRLSDFISRRGLHRTDLYAHVYSRIPQEYQMGIALPARGRPVAGAGQIIGLTLGRTRRDFDDSHLRLLEAVRPSFERTLERLHEMALLRAMMAGDPDYQTRWLLLADATGVVAWASPAATDALGITPGDRLPAPIGGRTESPVTVSGLTITVRRIPDAYPGLDALHLTPVNGQPTPTQLRTLGLTRRQAEILALALAGHTAAQVAEQLILSRRTVEKHFERIYARLGATNRTQAIVAALEGVRPPTTLRAPAAPAGAGRRAQTASNGHGAGR